MFFWNSVSLESSECRQFDLCFLCLFSTQLVPLEVHHSVHFSSVTQLCLTLPPHGLQHTSPPCPSRTLELAQTHVHRVHPTVSSSVVPFSSCLISFPASGSFPVGQFFASGGQIIGVSASASNPSNEYSGLISFWIDLFRLVVKLSLKDFEGNLASLLNEHSCVVV